MPFPEMSEPTPAVSQEWHVLIYRIPSEPTRLRATVWRRLKALGSIYLQNSVVALPASSSAERSLRKLRHEITEMSGTAILLRSQVLAGESNVLSIYQEARADEYVEIADKCRDFLTGLEKEYAENHFSYAELEENEVDLAKLQSWLETIVARDVFNAPGREEGHAMIAECTQALEAYAAQVYAAEPEGH